MNKTDLTLEQFVAGEAEEVYLALTNATLLRRWLCDVATVDPKIGGRFYAAWNNGFYASGEYTLLEPDREVGLQWVGRHHHVALLHRPF